MLVKLGQGKEIEPFIKKNLKKKHISFKILGNTITGYLKPNTKGNFEISNPNNPFHRNQISKSMRYMDKQYK